MSSLPEPSLTSHAQPEPKRVVAAAVNFSLKGSNPPKVLLIASAILPLGCPPFFGPMIVQKREWLEWPPALLRTAVRMFSGTMAQLLASSSSRDLPARLDAD